MLSHFYVRTLLLFALVAASALQSSCQGVSAGPPNATPNHGGIGAAVMISGSGFGAFDASTSKVIFNGTVANAVASDWSDTKITVTVPAGATTGALQIVAGPAASPTQLSAGTFTVDLTLNMTPETGLPGVNVEVTGSFPGATLPNTTVTVAGKLGSVWSVSAGTVKFTTPADAVSGDVVVNVTGRTPIDVGKFTIATPTLTPNQGSVGSQITLSGAAFGAPQGTSVVSVGGIASHIVTWSNDQVVVEVPKCMSPGQQKVQVTVGGKAIEPGNFTVEATAGWTDDCDEKSFGNHNRWWVRAGVF